MATERLSTRKTREILRLKWALGQSHREVALSPGISSGAVGSTMLRARAAGLDWPQVQTLADDALEARLYGRPEVASPRRRPQPDCAALHAERRKPGVTLELLHLEYLERHPWVPLHPVLRDLPPLVRAPGHAERLARELDA